MTVVCEPLDYVSASDALATTHESVGAVARKLLSDLSGSGGMAGWDAAGQEFAAGYDETTGRACVAISGLVTAAAHLTDLLHATGFNHANADNPKLGPGEQPADYPPTPALSGGPQSAVQVPPTANGGDPDPPWGWSLVEAFVGYLWPNGDEDRLRSADDAWGLAAAGLDTAALSVGAAEDLVAAQQSPEVPSVLSALSEYRQQLHDVADCCRELGQACTDYANHLEEAHDAILDELNQFLWETAAIGALGVAGSFFTLGGAAAGGTAAVAARAAVYGRRIALLVEKLLAATGIVGRALIAAGAKVASTSTKITEAVAARGRVLAEKIPALSRVGKPTLGQQLDNATTFPKGDLPAMNGPKDGILVKRDADGNVTNYTAYDNDGFGIKRVDLVGKPHFDGNQYIPTPHVVDIVKNTNPTTGESFARTLRNSVRPAFPEEIP